MLKAFELDPWSFTETYPEEFSRYRSLRDRVTPNHERRTMARAFSPALNLLVTDSERVLSEKQATAHVDAIHSLVRVPKHLAEIAVQVAAVAAEHLRGIEVAAASPINDDVMMLWARSSRPVHGPRKVND